MIIACPQLMNTCRKEAVIYLNSQTTCLVVNTAVKKALNILLYGTVKAFSKRRVLFICVRVWKDTNPCVCITGRWDKTGLQGWNKKKTVCTGKAVKKRKGGGGREKRRSKKKWVGLLGFRQPHWDYHYHTSGQWMRLSASGNKNLINHEPRIN